MVVEIKNKRMSKRKSRPTQDPTLASLPATQDLLARLKSYADEADEDEDEGRDKDEGNDGVEAEEEDEGYSTDSLEEEVQRTSRRWAVVRRNLGHDQLNEKSFLAHVREQTNAVATNLIHVNDIGKDKDSPSKRTSKRLSKLAKRGVSKTP